MPPYLARSRRYKTVLDREYCFGSWFLGYVLTNPPQPPLYSLLLFIYLKRRCLLFYIAPAFMDKLVVHITKNFMTLPNIKVPLILGVWGGKGQGKSFQCELVFAKMGITPIMMSAGELESGNAGEPAKLIRQRYREAADIIKKGKMCCFFINDLDAGAGRMGGTTQYTIKNQMVNATLMNIADNPTNVQLSGMYNKEENPRVPIIVTGNDFSTLYAPLIRDGRMEKFYWAPTREDHIGVCIGIFNATNVQYATPGENNWLSSSGMVFDLEKGLKLHIDLAESNSRSKRSRTDDERRGSDKRAKGSASFSRGISDSGVGSVHMPGLSNSAYNTIGYPSAQSHGSFDGRAANSGPRSRNSSAPPCPTIFVANLGPACTEQELIQVFSRCPGYLKLKVQSTYGTPVAFVDL
ncbi:ribulose bisphosphate carboxylase/oxygenase activase 2 protein [Artemisia annua]|uniref:Ribulose bisphosphate carboxylase/oxygenase activase, chloroplastic n=1 Tax=Artemisia annua TaxID=35608 RepID=A0A2U1PEB1_ARTAN|nr:ribulose bisphosphate carboxylase/oxygenase activase 2 protein [Artemisia annua]